MQRPIVVSGSISQAVSAKCVAQRGYKHHIRLQGRQAWWLSDTKRPGDAGHPLSVPSVKFERGLAPDDDRQDDVDADSVPSSKQRREIGFVFKWPERRNGQAVTAVISRQLKCIEPVLQLLT